MNVTVSPVDLPEVFFDGSVVVVTGTSEDGRSRVTFVGDSRPTRSLLMSVAESGEPQVAVVEHWQVTRQQPIAKPLSRTATEERS
jgi:hypothetical protein